MIPASSINKIEITVRVVLAAALSLGALVAAPALAQSPPTIEHGVTIHTVAVGGMTAAEAKAAVHNFATRPFTLRFRTRTLQPAPWSLGVKSKVNLAVSTALAAGPNAHIPLTVSLDIDQLRHYVDKLDRLLARGPRDAHVRLHKLRPHLSQPRNGFDILPRPTRILLKKAIRANSRGPVSIQYRYIKPEVTRRNFKPVVVIRRGSHRLYFYKGAHMRLRANFGVAVGQPIYPTPVGKFTIVTMQRNPWWYPPDSEWAAGASPIPPGPGNPLGTRWMGLSASGVGIHGTPDAASIGYSASHGCIRMRIPDAEWLFERVKVGSTVFIVKA
jgi:lipoprotein-anchoring transpeptidase ErfK/SrfK